MLGRFRIESIIERCIGSFFGVERLAMVITHDLQRK
jgi:hypothetical protein